MGTNYYYETAGSDPCPHCGRGDDSEKLHIGKSSAGWAFSLHIIPDKGINSLEDWQKLWASGGQIRNEYGEYECVEGMLSVITQRSHPSGLRRHGDGSGGYVFVQPGEPTYDLADYEFS